jgi:hypothetical protein
MIVGWRRSRFGARAADEPLHEEGETLADAPIE